MLFVANRFGSHNPNEYMAMDDFLNAAGILARTVMDFDR
jgi:N-carbamoyl-L-amino-acid hydrolase